MELSVWWYVGARPSRPSAACTPRRNAAIDSDWQIVPAVLGDMNASSDRVKAKRVLDAMMKMVKLDIAKLKAAFDGK